MKYLILLLLAACGGHHPQIDRTIDVVYGVPPDGQAGYTTWDDGQTLITLLNEGSPREQMLVLAEQLYRACTHDLDYTDDARCITFTNPSYYLEGPCAEEMNKLPDGYFIVSMPENPNLAAEASGFWNYGLAETKFVNPIN